MKKPATIYDIAKQAGVSPATVSRVLSNSGYPVRTAVAEKVRLIARELRYTPNLIGRQLKTNKSSTVAAIVPSITNPFYAEVVAGVEEAASARGYQVLLCNSGGDPALERRHLTMLHENQVRGVVLSSVLKNHAPIRQYRESGMIVVAMDQTYPGTGDRQISFDFKKGGSLMTRHLLHSGHTDIAFLSPSLDRPSRKQIFKGFEHAFRESRLPLDKSRALVSDGPGGDASAEFESGRRLARRLLQTKPWPTAIFACNDMMAFGVIRELASHGIRVPDDMSVAGFDNLSLGEIAAPSLTTIDQPKREMGALACELLIALMNGEAPEKENVTLQPALVERNSVRKLV